jgi:inosine-uridine nucleoside N-ribohydrolase
MLRQLRFALVGLAVLTSAAWSVPPVLGAEEPRSRIPVILDTDIGDDIDDTWALVMLLRSPELDLRLVLTDYGDTVYRARLVAKLLQVAGRTDVPIGIGIRQWEKEGPQAAWVKDYALAQYPGRVHEDGVQALVDTVMASKEPITLVAIGPPPNLHEALKREPRIASRLRFAGMYGSLRKGYGDKPQPEPEWNVKASPAAARAVLQAPWAEAVVTPLDTCGRVQLSGERYRRLAAAKDKDPLVDALLENYRVWCPQHDWCARDATFVADKSSTLFDTVAVYLAISSDLVKVERLGVSVSDDGRTTVDAKAPALGWATEWKSLDAFEELLVTRLAGPAPAQTAPGQTAPAASAHP